MGSAFCVSGLRFLNFCFSGFQNFVLSKFLYFWFLRSKEFASPEFLKYRFQFFSACILSFCMTGFLQVLGGLRLVCLSTLFAPQGFRTVSCLNSSTSARRHFRTCLVCLSTLLLLKGLGLCPGLNLYNSACQRTNSLSFLYSSTRFLAPGFFHESTPYGFPIHTL